MKSLLLNVSLLTGIMFCMLPWLVPAQTVIVVVPDSLSAAHSLETIEATITDDFNGVDTLHYDMPIYKPGRKAVIKTFRPSEDLIFNMPIWGNQTTRDENELNVWIYPDSLLKNKNN